MQRIPNKSLKVHNNVKQRNRPAAVEVTANAPMRLLYFSPVYASSYAQRPHFMVRAWLESGVESVLWVNPYPCRLPRWQDLCRSRSLDDQGTPLDPRIRVLNVPALPIEPLPLGGWMNRQWSWKNPWRELEEFAAAGPTVFGIGRPSGLALAALRELQPTASFFDAMDNFPEFHRGLSRCAMRRHEDAIADSVDLIVASSAFLAEKFIRRGLRVEKVLNAGEFGRERDGDDSSFLASRSSVNGPVLGYLGCLGRWFDWPLVIELAKAVRHSRIELVGPCVVPPPANLPPNVRLLPACKQTKVAGHLARFSVGLIPFRNNPLTIGVDPIKFYEYRAAGLPVLSTRFGEMAFRGRDDGVYFIDPGADLAVVVRTALGHHLDAAEIEEFSRDNDWRARFRQTTLLRSLMAAPSRRRAA